MFKFCSKCGNKLTLNTKTFDSECDRCGFVIANPDAEELRAQYVAEHPEELNKEDNVVEAPSVEPVQEEVAPKPEPVIFVDTKAIEAKKVELNSNKDELKEELLDYIHDRENNLNDVLAFYNFFENTFKKYQRFSDAELLNIMFEIYEYLPTNLVDKYREGYTNFKVKLDSIDKIDSNNTLIEAITKAKENFLDYYSSLKLEEYNKKALPKIKDLKERALKDIDFLSDLEHFNDEYNSIKTQFIDNISQYKIVSKQSKKNKTKTNSEKAEGAKPKKSRKGLVFALVFLFLIIGGVVAAGFIPTVQYESVSAKYNVYAPSEYDESILVVTTKKVKGAEVVGIKGLIWDSYFPIKNIVIDQTTEYGDVVSIGKGAFKGLQIESVTLPSTLKVIKDSAFEGTALTEVTLPQGLRNIKKSAFKGCTSLANVNYTGTPEQGLIIENEVFNGCKKLQTFNKVKELPYGIVSLGEKALYKIGSKVMYINETLKSIALNTFSDKTTVTIALTKNEFSLICPGYNYTENQEYLLVFDAVNLNLGSAKNGYTNYNYLIIKSKTEKLEDEILAEYKNCPGYEFQGLYAASTCVFDADGRYVAEELSSIYTLVPKYETIIYNIFYNLNGGTLSYPTTNYSVDRIVQLPTPTKKDYVFLGWKYNDEYVENTSNLIGDITLTAEWYHGHQVKFYNGAELYETINVPYGSSIGELPDLPTSKHSEWRIGSTSGSKLAENIIITNNMDVYAYVGGYTITYMSNYFSIYRQEYVLFGETVQMIENPTKANYFFAGWYKDSSCTQFFEFNGELKSDIILYAKWIETASNVSYIFYGGEKTYSYYANGTQSYSSMRRIAVVALHSGTLTVYSSTSSNTYGYLFNANGSQLTYNDDGGEDNNFYYTYNLTAGNVYYISARYYNSSSDGNFSINVSMPNNTSTLVAVSK